MNKRLLVALTTVVIALWIAFYFWFAFRYSSNIPVGDDFELFLHFWLKYQHATSFSEKLALLFAQFVEHRLGYTRFVFLFLAKWGLVDFRIIALVGNLSLVGLFFIFRHLLCRHFRLPIYYLLPVAFLIFQPCYSFDGVLWPAATLAYFPVAVGAILTLYLLGQQTRLTFWLGLFAGIVTTFTFGNGQFILLVALVTLALQQRWRLFWIWLSAMTLVLVSYYRWYQINTSRPPVLPNLIHYPKYILYNVLVFLGALTERSENGTQILSRQNAPSLLVGLAVVLVFAVVVLLWVNAQANRRQIHLTGFRSLQAVTKEAFGSRSAIGLFWLGALAFFVLSGCVFAMARTEAPLIYAHINRYRIHSVCAVLLSYSFVTVYLNRRTVWLVASCGASLLFAVFSYYNFKYEFAENLRTMQAGLYNWDHQKRWVIYHETAYWEPASKLISEQFEAQAADVYRFPKSLFEKADRDSVSLSLTVQPRPAEPGKAPAFLIRNETLLSDYVDPADGVYLVLTSSQRTLLLNTHLIRNSLGGFVRSGSYYKNGFQLELNTINIPEATYRMSLLRRQAGRNSLIHTPASLTIGGSQFAQATAGLN